MVQSRTQGTSPAVTTNYTYNSVYELIGTTGGQVHTFAYDKVNNRTLADSVSYTANNLNQYTLAGTTVPAYDSNANLTTDGTNTFTFDDDNRLTTAVNTQNSASYAYDAFDRRVSKAVNGTTTYFVYDGDQVIEDRSQTGTLIADYVYGTGIDEVLTMTKGSTTYYYHYDGLGSVTDITNASGTSIENYTYDVYGLPSINTPTGPVTASVVGNRYLFTGREWDAETGTYHYRRRYYDPSIGRFLSRDPIGYADSLNPYTYTRNNPINYTDPMGLLTIPGVGWVDVGEGSGQSALDYWANQAAQTDNPFLGGFYNLMGGFAALWTPCTSDKTATTLATGAGIGSYLGRPFYQYYPAGNPGYASNYLTRGWGWGAPYRTGSEAANKLSLPSYNPGTAVRQVKVNPFRYLKGPQRVAPDNGWEGGGIQYKIPD